MTTSEELKDILECAHENMGPDVDWPDAGLILNTCADCSGTFAKLSSEPGLYPEILVAGANKR